MKKSDAFSIFGIERLRMATDGKGIRTLVGLSGCPLACKYCINPQANMRSAAIWQFTPQMLIDKLMIDNLYFQSTGGGITFGGGEPLLHIDALSLFSEKCPQTWNLWVETSLYVPSETVNSHLSNEWLASLSLHFVDYALVFCCYFSSFSKLPKLVKNLRTKHKLLVYYTKHDKRFNINIRH